MAQAKSPPAKPPASATNQSSSQDAHSATSPDARQPDQPVALKAPVDAAEAQLLADTERLVKLTQELKAEVAKSSKDTLSLSVIKKAEEVEKLAKSLKERMNKTR